MRTRIPLIVALFCAVGMVLHGADPTQTEALRKQLLEYKARGEKGDAEAQFNLANCYREGQGVEKNHAEAAKWYRKAAEQNYTKAQFNLGNSYADGLGVKKDYAEALKWYRKAAEQNLAQAQFNLGVFYRDGQGVDKDYAEAYAWFSLAAGTFGPAAKNRDNLGRVMSPDQISDGYKRRKELRALIEAKLKGAGK